MWMILSVFLLWGGTAEGRDREDICKEGCLGKEVTLNDCRNDYLINITEISNLYKECYDCVPPNSCDPSTTRIPCHNFIEISDIYRKQCNRKKTCSLEVHYDPYETCATNNRNERINIQRICYNCTPSDIKTTQTPSVNGITSTTGGYGTSTSVPTSDKTSVLTTVSHQNTTIQIVEERVDNGVIIAAVIAACIVGVAAVTTIICVVIYVRKRALKRNTNMNVYKECGKDDPDVGITDNTTPLNNESAWQKNSKGQPSVEENTNLDGTNGQKEHNEYKNDSIPSVHSKGLVSEYEEVDLDTNTKQRFGNNEPIRSVTKDAAAAYEYVDIDKQDRTMHKTSGQSGESLNNPPNSNSAGNIPMSKSKAGYEDVDIDNNNPNNSIDQLYSEPFKKQFRDSNEIAALYAKPNKGPRALTKGPKSAIQDINKPVEINDGKAPLLQHDEPDQTNHSQEYYSCPIDVDPTYVDDNGDDYDALALGNRKRALENMEEYSHLEKR